MTGAIAGGVLLGVLYTLSPLTVLCLTALAALAWWTSRDLTPRERAWFATVIVVAMSIRLLAIAALFLLADPSRPYANFFGDEELFKSRTVWLRNAGLGVPISPADMIYVYDAVGQSSYLYLLALIQALVDDAPYGNNVLNACIYVVAMMIVYRVVRPAYGALAAMGGFVALLLLPSLLSWSVSVLKEPLYMLVAAIEFACAVQIVRGRTVALKIAAAVAVLLAAYALGSLRTGGFLLGIAGSVIGVFTAVVVTRPRWLLASIIVVPLIAGAAITRPAVSERLMTELQRAAFLHMGHQSTVGFTYEVLDDRFYGYVPRDEVFTMTAPEAARFTIRAFASFVLVPLPSQVKSRAALLYLPEQMVWYLIFAMSLIGIRAGLRRDPVVTCLLVSHALIASAMIALGGGNIGTLIRHRGLTLPYFIWLASLGACDVVRRLSAVEPHSQSVTHGEPAWR